MSILVYHGETLLGESKTLQIEPDFREPPLSHPIDCLVRCPVILTDGSLVEAAVSTPLLGETRRPAVEI